MILYLVLFKTIVLNVSSDFNSFSSDYFEFHFSLSLTYCHCSNKSKLLSITISLFCAWTFKMSLVWNVCDEERLHFYVVVFHMNQWTGLKAYIWYNVIIIMRSRHMLQFIFFKNSFLKFVWPALQQVQFTYGM